MKLAVVTATIDLARAALCLNSWWEQAAGVMDAYVVVQAGEANRPGWGVLNPLDPDRFNVYYSPELLGVVPAYAIGVRQALDDGADLIACFHDDLLIESAGWDDEVRHIFKACPHAGLVGFGGATGLADDNIYQVPYHPMQLARKNFGSNMRHAEAHGARWTLAQRIACLDGFSQIGKRAFWEGRTHQPLLEQLDTKAPSGLRNLFERMRDAGLYHHAYDSLLGAYAKRLGWQVWFAPVAVHHFGGLTAVADARYLEWAKQHVPAQQDQSGNTTQGDAAAWLFAHQWGYNEFRDTLPIRV